MREGAILRYAGRLAVLLLVVGAAAACGGGSDDVGRQDGGGGFDIVFVPADTGGGGTGDTATGDTKPAAGDAGDAAGADARVDGAAPPDASGGDAGPDDAGGPDAAPDTGEPCRDDGVGCPCASDQFCLAWDDGDLCNGHLVCREGRCAEDPTTVRDCGEADGYCVDHVCDPDTGLCEEVIRGEDGSSCEDGDPCTGGDTCQGGACVAGALDLCGGGGCELSRELTCGVRHPVRTDVPTPNEPDPVTRIEQYSCSPQTFPGPEKAYRFVNQPDTQAIFTVVNAQMALFLIPWGADCDVGSCLATTHPSRKLYHKDTDGGEYWLVVDGVSGFGGPTELKIECHPKRAEYRVECVIGSGGGDDCDICDDGIDNDWDGLTDCGDDECEDDPVCIPRVCGDDICHPTAEDVEECPEDCWECGDGLCTTPYESYGTCPGDCPCGDGTCSGADDETCATCPADCGDCTMPCVEQDIVCGQTVSRSNLSDEENDLSGYTCGCADGAREERAFRFVSPVTVQVGVQLAYEDPFEAPGVCSDDYDLYLLTGCDAAADCIQCADTSGCTEGLSFTAEAGVPYVIALEAATGTPWDDWDLRIVCN